MEMGSAAGVDGADAAQPFSVVPMQPRATELIQSDGAASMEPRATVPRDLRGTVPLDTRGSTLA